LNDCLFKGPNLIEQIPAILLRFRKKAIAVVADIRRAFLQIEVKENDRHFLRFLWWRKNDEIQVYQLNRVIFGDTCSPFLLGAVIKYHLNNTSDEVKPVANKLSKSYYIDICVTSVYNILSLEEFILGATQIMAEAKMNLRMWEFGPLSEIEQKLFKNKSLLEDKQSHIITVLGLKWDREDDSLMISNQFDLKLKTPSKREILSITQSIYDPIGFLAPAMLPAKLMIQEAWSTKTKWDAPLPKTIQRNFLRWYEELKHLSRSKDV